MRTLVVAVVLTFTLAAAAAQQQATQPPVLELKTFASSADVAALIAKAKRERKEGQALFSQPLLHLAPYTAKLEYRASVGIASLHETDGEVFYVIEGSATMVTGGKLVNPKPAIGETQGTAIEGGVSRHVAKGDFIIIPERTPHWFSAIDKPLVVVTLHVPRPVPGAH
jgi:mannose-6-phosphate isomerase-like protein (cupin superfamily)